jgi:hypothetical protein
MRCFTRRTSECPISTAHLCFDWTTAHRYVCLGAQKGSLDRSTCCIFRFSNFGRKKLELKWIIHQSLNSINTDVQYTNASAVGNLTQYPFPGIAVKQGKASSSLQGMATTGFALFFEWWTGRSPPQQLVNDYKPFMIKSMNYPKMVSRYGRQDTAA